MRRPALVLVAAVAALILPFVLLVRAAVWLAASGWPTTLAVLGGICTAAAVFAVLTWAVLRPLPHRPRGRTVFLWLALPATLGFVGQGLLTLAPVHAKTPAESADWRRTHPLLRLSVTALTLVDRSLVITDLARAPQDYAAWGLPPFERSQHLRQRDGYTHAMDLRTRNGGWLRNRLLEGYFRAMGFRTLRHVGTADHLHVGLPGGPSTAARTP